MRVSLRFERPNTACTSHSPHLPLAARTHACTHARTYQHAGCRSGRLNHLCSPSLPASVQQAGRNTSTGTCIAIKKPAFATLVHERLDCTRRAESARSYGCMPCAHMPCLETSAIKGGTGDHTDTISHSARANAAALRAAAQLHSTFTDPHCPILHAMDARF